VLAGRVTKWPEKIKNCGVLQGVGEKKYSGEKKNGCLGGYPSDLKINIALGWLTDSTPTDEQLSG